MKTETICVHAGGIIDETTRGVNTPIFTSSAFGYLDSDVRFYPRYFNTPNQAAVVQKLAALEQTEDGLIFSSGMAAVSAVTQAFLEAGDHAVIQDEVYGGTHAFVSAHFPRFGIQCSFARADADAIIAAIRPETRLIYIESPTNPMLTVVDIAKVGRAGRERGIITAIDNTFASPINQNPACLGIDVVIHSGTKYLGGHSDMCCGAVLASKEVTQHVFRTAFSLGGSLNANACYLLERSLKTLAIRVERQTENAMRIASWLHGHQGIVRVNYPGLPSHPGHTIASKQMKAFGAMMSFEVEGDQGAALRFMKRLKLILPALSLGGVDSTICDPVSTSHQKVPVEIREAMGITANVLRLSVGIEHADDLIADIDQALRN